MTLPPLALVTCPKCGDPQLVRRGRAGDAVHCRLDGSRLRVSAARPFGRTQWDATRDPRLLGGAVALLARHPSGRKRRLVAVAACRAVFGWCKNRAFRDAVTAAEQLARTGSTGYDLAELRNELDPDRGWIRSAEDWQRAALWCLDPDPVFLHPPPRLYRGDDLAAAIVEVIPNPFRPPVVPDDWRTVEVLNLARGVETDRAFDRLPILADALEEAGCTELGLLAHCRGAGPHAPGCWALDAVLGNG
jgi:hypothetical protein